MNEATLVLRPEAVVHRSPSGAVVLEAPWARVTLGAVGPGLGAAVEHLAGAGATEAALADLVAGADGPGALATLYFALQRAAARRLLGSTASLGGDRVVTAVPMTTAAVPTPVQVAVDDRVRLSRFAFARRSDGDGDLVVESPLTPVRVLLHGARGGALLAALADPISVADLPDAKADEAAAVLGVLVSAGIAGVTDADGTIAAEEAPALRVWEFHDLLFHSRSRRGRHDLPCGGTYRFRDELAPLPALKPVVADRTIPLPPASASSADGFADVLEARRSTRRGATSLTVAQLGALLARAAAVRDTGEVVTAPDERPYDVTRRPYPGAGAAYELELYPLVHRCAGLDPALYRYDPGGHLLELVAPPGDGTDRLLADAQWSADADARPDVLVVIAARFGRLSWKYAAIAYALVLKDVGVLIQTMSLVATSLGIGACALGTGDADLFAAVAGTDYYVETSVGELMLNGAP